METKKFLAELMKRIPEQENVKMELASDRINVNFGENNGFYVRASGGISCVNASDKMKENAEKKM